VHFIDGSDGRISLERAERGDLNFLADLVLPVSCAATGCFVSAMHLGATVSTAETRKHVFTYTCKVVIFYFKKSPEGRCIRTEA
jgi:hypothetical protein